MKKQFLILFLFLTPTIFVFAQARDPHTGTVITSWPASSPATAADETREVIRDIISVIGLKQDFEVRAANISNAAAVVYNGKRYVLYNPRFFSKLNVAAGNKWASVSVLAHEIGHHLNGHTLNNLGSQPNLELDADEFSGFVLRRMGATLEQSQAAMKLASNYKPSLTHPGQADRLFAIARGWNNADGQGSGKDLAKYDLPVSPEPLADKNAIVHTKVNRVAVRERNTSAIDERYILGDVYFNGYENALFFVTTRYNLVKIENNQLSVVGKVSRTNQPRIPYVITGSNTILYVDHYGKIFTRNGVVTGVMKQHYGYN